MFPEQLTGYKSEKIALIVLFLKSFRFRLTNYKVEILDKVREICIFSFWVKYSRLIGFHSISFHSVYLNKPVPTIPLHNNNGHYFKL